jgi:hypothetical protein
VAVGGPQRHSCLLKFHLIQIIMTMTSKGFDAINFKKTPRPRSRDQFNNEAIWSADEKA